MKKINLLLVVSFSLLLIGCADSDTRVFNKYKTFTAPQLLQKGKQSLAKRKYGDAVKQFEALDALYPFGPEAQIEQLDIIYAYYKNDDTELALSAADRYIHLYPRGEYTPYAFYMKGVINMDRGKTWLQKLYPLHVEQSDLTFLNQAFLSFSDLVNQFPTSNYAYDAREHMLYLRNLFAQYELDVADFYFQHKEYVAAANRASYVVKHYEGTPQTKQALKIMLGSYQALGETRSAQEVAEILKRNP